MQGRPEAEAEEEGGEKKCQKMFKVSSAKCQVITTDAIEDGGKKMPWGNGGGRGNMSKEEEEVVKGRLTGAETTTEDKCLFLKTSLNLSFLAEKTTFSQHEELRKVQISVCSSSNTFLLLCRAVLA